MYNNIIKSKLFIIIREKFLLGTKMENPVGGL